MAEWRSLPALRKRKYYGTDKASLSLAMSAVLPTRLPLLRACRDDLRKHQYSDADLVQSHLSHADQQKGHCRNAGASDVWFWFLFDRTLYVPPHSRRPRQA